MIQPVTQAIDLYVKETFRQPKINKSIGSDHLKGYLIIIS